MEDNYHNGCHMMWTCSPSILWCKIADFRNAHSLVDRVKGTVQLQPAVCTLCVHYLWSGIILKVCSLGNHWW